MATKTMTQPWLWKRLAAGSSSQYVPKNGELLLAKTDQGETELRLGDNSTAKGLVIGAESEYTGAATPTVLSPANDVTVGTVPIITTSEFAWINDDKTAAEHTITHWQVSTNINFTNLVFNKATTTELTHVDLAANNVNLVRNSVHYIRVRHGSANGYSAWSAPSSFTYFVKKYEYVKQRVPNSLEDAGYVTGHSEADDNSRIAVGHSTQPSGNAHTGVVVIYRNDGGAWRESMIIPPHTDYITGSPLRWGWTVGLSPDGSRLAVSLEDGSYLAFAVFTLSGDNYTYNGLVHVTTLSTGYISNKPGVRLSSDYFRCTGLSGLSWLTNDTLLLSIETESFGNGFANIYLNEGAHAVVNVRTGTIGYSGATAPWLRGEWLGPQDQDANINLLFTKVGNVAYIYTGSAMARVDANGGSNNNSYLPNQHYYKGPDFLPDESYFYQARSSRVSAAVYNHYVDIKERYNANGYFKNKAVISIPGESYIGTAVFTRISEDGTKLIFGARNVYYVVEMTGPATWSSIDKVSLPKEYDGVASNYPIMLNPASGNAIVLAASDGLYIYD